MPGSYLPTVHQRKQLRLIGFDYGQPGRYFITICCAAQQHHFGEVCERQMKLSRFGTIALQTWEALPARFPFLKPDVVQIMPDHMHGVLHIGASHAPSDYSCVGAIIGAYKSLVANACLALCKESGQRPGKIWHRNYYEHIIRNDAAYERIAAYIRNNPAKWHRRRI